MIESLQFATGSDLGARNFLPESKVLSGYTDIKMARKIAIETRKLTLIWQVTNQSIDVTVKTT